MLGALLFSSAPEALCGVQIVQKDTHGCRYVSRSLGVSTCRDYRRLVVETTSLTSDGGTFVLEDSSGVQLHLLCYHKHESASI